MNCENKTQLTSRQRFCRILKRQSVDRVGLFENFWPETVAKWRQQGHLGKDETPEDHFNLDMRRVKPFNLVANLDYVEDIVEEDDQTELVRDGNGALLRRLKNSESSTPEHVDFLVKNRADWEKHIRPYLVDQSTLADRIDFDIYRQSKEKCNRQDLFLCWAGVNVFECIHPICGHEYMLMGMALDPDWIKDMADVYSNLLIKLMKILFDSEGRPDALWFSEDMGFKNKPFMSPQMYKEMIQPYHKRTFDFAHSIGLPVIMHSCGFVEPLVPGLIEAGLDCLQAMEVKAGMDVRRLKKQFGDRLVFMGGMNTMAMIDNDQNAVAQELDKKLPIVMKDGGYILQSDHSIPQQVEYETYRFFVEHGLKVGTY